MRYSHQVIHLSLLLLLLIPLVFTFRATTYNIPKVVLSQLLIMLVFVLWLINMNERNCFSIRKTPLNLPVILFLIWAALSSTQAINKYEALQAICQLSAFLLLYFIVVNNVHTMKELNSFLITMIIVGMLISVYGLIQTQGIDFSNWETGSAPISTLGNVNFAAGYLITVIPLSLTMLLITRSHWRRTILALASLLMLGHLFLTKSRGAWVGLTIALAIMGTSFLRKKLHGQGPKVKKVFLPMTVTILILALFLSSPWGKPGREEASSIFDPDHPSNAFRILVWKSSLKMIKDNPFLGIGIGNFKLIYSRYRSLEEWKISGINVQVLKGHNDYLQIASEMGLIGLGLFFWIIISMVKLYRIGKGDVTSGLMAALMATLIHAFFSFNLQNPATSLYFWFIVGLMAAAYPPIEKKEHLVKRRNRFRYLAIWLAAVAMLIFLPSYILRPLRADFHFKQAKIYEARKMWKEAIQECKKSTIIHSHNISTHFLCGKLLERRGEYDQAIAEIKTTLKLHPNYPWGYNSLGNIYLKKAETDEAVDAFRRASQFNPRYYNNLGIAYIEKGDLDEGMEALRKALAAKIDTEVTYVNLGLIYGKRGNLDKAIESYKKAIQLNPDYEKAHLNLATAYLDKGDYEEALREAKFLVRLRPNLWNSHALLAAAYEAQGNLTAARKEWKKVLALDPENHLAKEHLKKLSDSTP